MTFLKFLSLLIFFSFTSCLDSPKDKTANILITSNLSGLAASAPVKIKLYNSSNVLVAAASGTVILGNLSLKLNDIDSNGAPVSSYASFKDDETYYLYIAIDNNNSSAYDLGEKISLTTLPITKAQINASNGTLTFAINSADFKDSVMKPVTASLTSVDGKTAYCFWLKNPVQPVLSVFSKTQELSITKGIFAGGAVTVNSNYNNWPALVPGMTYNVYCFVDTDGNSIPDYNVDYEGSLTNVFIETSAQASVPISFVKINR